MTAVKKFVRILRSDSESNTGTETILKDDEKRPPASEYIYGSRKFTERQENFHQNLLRLYRLTDSEKLPVYFSDDAGDHWRMDRGCIAMAVQDGFLKELENDSPGRLTAVVLSWVKRKNLAT